MSKNHSLRAMYRTSSSEHGDDRSYRGKRAGNQCAGRMSWQGCAGKHWSARHLGAAGPAAPHAMNRLAVLSFRGSLSIHRNIVNSYENIKDITWVDNSYKPNSVERSSLKKPLHRPATVVRIPGFQVIQKFDSQVKQLHDLHEH